MHAANLVQKLMVMRCVAVESVMGETPETSPTSSAASSAPQPFDRRMSCDYPAGPSHQKQHEALRLLRSSFDSRSLWGEHHYPCCSMGLLCTTRSKSRPSVGPQHSRISWFIFHLKPGEGRERREGGDKRNLALCCTSHDDITHA